MEIPTAPVNESLKAIKRLKAEELKNILRDREQPVTGKKADLVLRCHVLSERQKTLTNVLPGPSKKMYHYWQLRLARKVLI